MPHAVSKMVLIWSGSIETIPAGWALCNGSNGTPNLTDRFVRGAGVSFDPGDTGGNITHTHPFVANPHSHELVAGGGPVGAGASFQDQTDSVQSTGTTAATSSLPPWYALAYIMLL